MLVLLPVLSFLCIMLWFVACGVPYRRAFLLAAVCFGALVTAYTELASLLGAIDRLTMSVFWGCVAAASGTALYRKRPGVQFSRPASDTMAAAIGIGVILATTLLIALVSPPNNWDSMTYHMARVMHWIQNRSVAFYPTGITRQLYSAPWAEYAIMHLQILSGGDRFANLVQWFALCGGIVGVTLIAEECGAPVIAQACAAVVAATIPMGILQASSTQNDLAVSFWLVCFVYFGMRMARQPDLPSAAAAGASLGLAVLTKGTAYIFAAPFVVWFLCAGLRRHGRVLPKYLAVIAALFIALNTGQYLRNYALWGSPLATDTEKLSNDRIGVKALVSNLSRNMASLASTPGEAASLLEYRGVELLHDALGIDVSDPATTFAGTKFTPRMAPYHEDYAGNFLHLVLICAVIPAVLLRRKQFTAVEFWYAMALAGGFVLFNLLLKWQPWGTRLQLPFFVLAAPLVAAALSKGESKRPAFAVAAVLLVCSTPWLLANSARPLVGEWTILTTDREKLYFVNKPRIYSSYLAGADDLARGGACENVGLTGSIDAYEYPFWAMVARRTALMPRMEYIDVDNASKSIPLRGFKPCAVFRLQ